MVMVLAIVVLVSGKTDDFNVAVAEGMQLFVEKRNLVRRRNEVERAFKGFSWIFPPDLAQRFAHEYQQPPQSQQSPESLFFRAHHHPQPLEYKHARDITLRVSRAPN